MYQHPARQPTGGEFLIGNLAKKFIGSFHSYVKKTIITFLLHLCFYFLPHFPFFLLHDSTNTWATCPDGYFMGGLYRTGKNHWLHNIEEARCCKPEGLPDKYADCYNENVWGSFDGKGLSECKREGYYMAGIFRGKCDKLYCLEEFKCCRMIGKRDDIITYIISWDYGKAIMVSIHTSQLKSNIQSVTLHSCVLL